MRKLLHRWMQGRPILPVDAIPSRRVLVQRTVRVVDERVGVAKNGGRKILDKIFPDHWSFFLGEIALYSFIVLVLSGVFLALYFNPSLADVVYHGKDKALRGQHMSAAYASTVALSFSVRTGLLMRQMHHWAADVFIGAIVLHMCRIFFTSAYRKPREPNWMIGLTMLVLAVINGYAGYSLPNDLVSGTGLRIGYSIILSIPLIGTYLATFLFGGQFPGNGSIEPRLFIAHVFIVPLLIIGLLGAHLALIVRQEHTQWPKPGRTEKNVVGLPLYPNFLLKTIGLMLMVAGVLWALGGLVQINPIFNYGPFVPYKASDAAQPDWYMGWLEGALRMAPNWEFASFGHTIPFPVLIPAVMLPVVTFGIAYLWPYIDKIVTGDFDRHNLVTPPSRRPVHTAIGAAVVTFYFMLTVAGGDDVLAKFLGFHLRPFVWALRAATFALPLIVGLVTHRLARQIAAGRDHLQRRQAVAVELSGGSYELSLGTPPEDDEEDPVPVPRTVLGPSPRLADPEEVAAAEAPER